MCGILGLFGKVQLRQILVPMQLLTHRGQDATGIAWKSGESIKMKKCYGYFDKLEITDESTDVCIGYTRYQTSSFKNKADLDKFSHPYMVKTKYGDLCLVHNGNITNIPKLSGLIDYKDYYTDTDFVTHLFGFLIDKNKGNITASVRQLMNLLDGAYSIAAILGNKLIVFRDPKGIRPLVIGETQDFIMAASERVCYQLSESYKLKEVKPGELLIIDKDGIHSKILVEEEHAHCMFEYVYFAHPSSTIEGKNLYNVRTRLGENLGKRIIKKGIEVDVVACVPDTSRPAAMRLSEVIGVPYREILIKNRHVDRTFIMRDMESRKKYAHLKYIVNYDLLKGKRILIVDDSIVRGITSSRIVDLLRNNGAKEVHFASTCPPIISPCYYGIDFATHDELIADTKSVEDIRKKIGADSLIYSSVQELKDAIDLPDLCTACVTKKYPTQYGQFLNEAARSKKINEFTRHYQA
jgi:amidophosphoribosyltransferase